MIGECLPLILSFYSNTVELPVRDRSLVMAGGGGGGGGGAVISYGGGGGEAPKKNVFLGKYFADPMSNFFTQPQISIKK